jgi:hypothetical protein
MSNCKCKSCAERRIGRRIVTEYVYPPIPERGFDWSAVTVDYEPGQPMGWGPNEEMAIADLIDQQEMHDDCRLGRLLADAATTGRGAI